MCYTEGTMKLRLGTRTLHKGFTVVELMAVITVIAILVTISIVAYNGLTGRATDNVVISDAETLEALQTQYALQNDTGGKSWFSGNGIDQDLSFTVSEGIIVDAVANSRAFCIRSFSPASNSYQTLYTAYTVESSPGACVALPPSQDAINADAQAAPSGWILHTSRRCSMSFSSTSMTSSSRGLRTSTRLRQCPQM